ncbi:sensor histidine kinase [uncultured Eubacterium sp.]|uniref:sensor histidine kinase n=1 Tax=uncultured Eubacterium sp. TaxID=165185 RepID=UPI0026032243|nr:GHKL domain-containing protein [uncultured Eubacterium sp.]
MTKIIIDIFMYLFEFLMVFYYSDILFSEKKSRKTRIVIFLLNTTFLGCVYQLNITYLNIALMFLSYTLLFYFLYDISFKTALFHSLLFLIVMFATEIITSIIGVAFFDDFNALEKNISAYVFVTVISKLLYFSIMMVILKFLAQKESTDNKFFWLLFVMPLSSMFILICFRYITYQITLTQIMNVLWIVSCIGILFANILVFVIYEFSLKNSNELHEIKEIQRQQEQDEKYYEILEQTNKEMHLFSHDIKNHLTQIRNLEDINAVNQYIDKLYPTIEKFSYTGISKNKMLDLIISKYATLCESKKIKFDVDVKTSNLSYIDDVDLSTLMNNLLDNAVEAAKNSNNAFVQLNVFSKNNIYDGLIIKNSCFLPPVTDNKELKTRKSDKAHHGLGIKSINKIVKKYGAVYDWKYDNQQKVFETEVIFMKKN